MELALTIVAIGSALGSFILWATLLTEDRAARRAIERRQAAQDFIHDFADDPRPASLLVQPPFLHREGL
jgi:hypothetical protein